MTVFNSQQALNSKDVSSALKNRNNFFIIAGKSLNYAHTCYLEVKSRSRKKDLH